MDTKIKGATCTNRQSLKQVAKAKKVAPETLFGLPKVDENLLYLWDYFVAVFSGGELSFQELLAWSTLCRIQLTSEEITILRKLAFAILEQRASKTP